MNEVSHDRGAAGTKSENAGRDRSQHPALVAVDLGAESCRVSLLLWTDGRPEIRLVHRFANSARNDGNGLRWNIAAIRKGLRPTLAPGNRGHRSGRLGRGLRTPGRRRATGG